MEMKYKIKGLVLVLLTVCFAAHAQRSPGKEDKNTATVGGVIKDAATGKALIGVRISYGQLYAAITDSAGKFSMKVPDSKVTIRLEADGYQAQEVALKGRNQITTSLYESSFKSLYDDATLPFETVPQSNLTVAATNVQTDGSWKQIAETPDAYLQGKVAGLNSIRRSGTPDMGANLFLRGFSSLYATNQPLVIVDGVMYDNDSHGNSLISGFYQNPLSFVDLKDIDNISVIKDGSSTYGTKGANGVILISTNRAKQEATAIDVAIYSGVNFTPDNIPVLNANDYRIYLSEMLQSKGLTADQIQALPYMNDNTSNPQYYKYHNNNDWQSKIFKSTSSQNGYLKISGGDEVAKYALTMGYQKTGGIITNTDLAKYNTRFNADFNLSKRLTASANLNFTYKEQDLKNTGTDVKTNPIFAALIKAPFLATNDIDVKGIASPSLADKDTFNISNPLAIVQSMIGLSKSYRFVGSLNFNYVITKNLSAATTIAVIMDKDRESFFIPQHGIVQDTLPNAVVTNQSGAQVLRMFNVYNDTKLAYTKTFNSIHQLAVRAGIRFQQSKTEQDVGLGYNSATDQLTGVTYGLNSLRSIGGSLGQSRWWNTYLNADYNLLRKYFLSFNMAIDGSSRFGADASDGSIKIGNNHYAVMPSLSAAWLLSSEKMMANIKWIDLLKIRGSIGMTGNDDIGNFTARKYYVSQNLLGVEGLVRGNAGNPNLQWETITRLNGGIDLAILKERVSISFDAFHSKTTNMIVYEPAASATGLAYNITNSGAMQTTGEELSLNARIVNSKNLKWDLNITVAHNQSKITQLPQANILTDFADATILTLPGVAPNVFYGYKTNGVFASNAAATASGLSIRNANGSLTPFKGGDVQFQDLNGDKVIDATDRAIIGNPNPKYFGSFSTNVAYKNFALNALFTFSQGNQVYNYTRRQLESMSGYANQTQAVLNRWKNDGQITNTPKATWGDPMGNSRFSDRWIEDGSYIRLRTVSLSYQIPIKNSAIKYTVLYLNGNNLVTFTKYMGYDPEFSATTSPIGQGVDLMGEPIYRSVQVGVRLGL